MKVSHLFSPDDNCWKYEKADKAFTLVDAENYFENLFINLLQAKRSIYILGWDLDSRQPLLCGPQDQRDGVPVRLGELLDWLARRQPDLEINILCWDYSPIYIMGRESFQSIKLGWQTHERVHFHFDDQHPVTSSHHHKIVVIDDQLAYCGGIDLTGARWDTCAHDPANDLRRLPNGTAYAPFHDVQAAVIGQPAASLGELCRERWLNATGQRLKAPDVTDDPARFTTSNTVWDNVPIAIARTQPAFKNLKEIREVERLHLDMLKQAKRYIYIENQYLASEIVATALVRSLRQAHGPEVVIVLPKHQDNWLSRHTMGTLSNRCIALLRSEDKYGRLEIYYPEDRRLTGSSYINVHAKLMIVDDRYVRIGSANLNNRSMGLDTECDLIFDASHSTLLQQKARNLLTELIGHQVGANPQEVEHAWQRCKSLRQAIKSLNKDPKSLERHHDDSDLGAFDSFLADVELIDPRMPIGVERLVDDFVFRAHAARDLTFARYIPTGLLFTFFFCILLAITRFVTPLSPYLREGSFSDAVAALNLSGPAEGWFLLAFAGLGTLFVPLNLLIILSACFFPPMQAFALAVVGSIATAAVGYGIGSIADGRRVERLMGKAIFYLRRAVTRHSTLAIFLVRFFPIAPYALINIAAGNARVQKAPYFLGTVAGILPGIIALVAFHRGLLAAIEEPHAWALLRFALIVLAIAALFYALTRRLMRVRRETKQTARGSKMNQEPGYAS